MPSWKLTSMGVAGWLTLQAAAVAGEPAARVSRPVAPPTPPPVLVASPAPVRTTLADTPMAPAAGGTLYSIGDPTDDEQYYLELINRARADPAAEGVRLATTTDADVLAAYAYFSVDLAMMQAEFAVLPARPPLAMNALLSQAARDHAQDQFDHAFQGHVGTDGRTLGPRVTDSGYVWTSLGENVYSYADSTWHGHAGFQVDWGSGGTGGMQAGRGHRANIHGNFREIGIGVINGSNTYAGNTVGPQLVTQDFGSSSQVFVTGVAYHDINGNGFYNPGEGVGGLTVEVSGAAHYAVTSASGGYAVPVPSATTTRTVTFTGPGLLHSAEVALTAGANAKVDYAAAYMPPVTTGPAAPPAGLASAYTFTTLGGATGYDWLYAAKTVFADDDADAPGRVEASTTGGYAPLATDVKFAGTGSYHLAHPTAAHQFLTYPDTLFAGPAASIAFRSRLGWATADQTARLELSADGGATWQALYSQAGTSSAGETTFQLRTVSLAAFAGKSVRLRFAYRFSSGSYYTGTGAGVGWYIDQIDGTDLHVLASPVITPVTAGQGFTFTPPAVGTYLLAVRPRTPGRDVWPAGPYLEVTSVVAPPFALWAAGQETDAGLPAGTIRDDPEGDFNGDGLANLMAYALGRSAVASSAFPASTVTGGVLRLVYTADTAHTDIIITPRISSDLRTWHVPGAAGAPAGFQETVLFTTGTIQTRELAVPVSSGNPLFMGLQVSRP